MIHTIEPVTIDKNHLRCAQRLNDAILCTKVLAAVHAHVTQVKLVYMFKCADSNSINQLLCSVVCLGRWLLGDTECPSGPVNHVECDAKATTSQSACHSAIYMMLLKNSRGLTCGHY